MNKLKAALQEKNREASHRLELVPKEEWPPSKKKPLRVWRSRLSLVQEYQDNGHIRLSITDARDCKGFANGLIQFGDKLTWDELQRIKDEVGYADKCLVEVYPPADRVINVANMRHLWVLDKLPSFCW